MEKYIIFSASTIIIVTLMVLSRHWLNRRFNKTHSEESNSKTVKQPKAYLYVGIGGLIIFFAIALFTLLAPENMISNYEEGMRLPIFFIMLTLCTPYIFMMILQLNWKIEIKENDFNFRNIFGIKNSYKYDEVEVKYLSGCTRYYRNGKHIVGISYLQENWDSLEKAINKYKKELKNKNSK